MPVSLSERINCEQTELFANTTKSLYEQNAITKNVDICERTEHHFKRTPTNTREQRWIKRILAKPTMKVQWVQVWLIAQSPSHTYKQPI